MNYHLDKALTQLKKDFLTLSTSVEDALSRSVKALTQRDDLIASKVIKEDEKIDERELEIEEDCLKILALYQPVAKDLRFVVSTLKMNNDLERVGDLAVNIAERALFLNSRPAIEPPFDVELMASLSGSMLTHAVDAIIEKDVKKARQVLFADDEVDVINRETYQNVYLAIKSMPQKTEELIHYLSISRHLERIGDYATNIAEEVIYMIEGRLVRHQPENFLDQVQR